MGISEKLNYLVETKNQIKSALNTPYNVFRDYATLISKYVKNQPKSIVEGSSAICENAVDLPCSIDVNGNSYQYSTEGYNLYNVNDKKSASNGITVDKEGWITVTYDNTNGTAIKYFEYFTNAIKNLKPSTNYMIVTEIKEVTGNATLYSVSWGGQFNSDTIYEFSNVKNNGIYVKGNLALDTADSKEVSLRTLVRYEVGESGSITFRLSCLEDTTITADTFKYEPYTNGASPNIEYPQEVEVITECSLVQRGKNYFNITDLSNMNLSQNNISSVTRETDKISFVTGSSSYSGIYFWKSENSMFIDNYDSSKEYTLSVDVETNVNTDIQIGAETTKTYTVNGKQRISVKGIITNSIVFYSRSAVAGTTITISNIMISPVDNDTYEPYIEPIVKPINLQGNSIAKVGEIKDLLNIGVDGSVKIGEENIKRYVFTGDEDWQLSTGWSTDNYKCFFATILQDTKFASWEKVYQKSNYFIAYSRDELAVLQRNGIGYSGLVNDGINTNNAPITIKIDSSVASTVDEFKAWLKEKYNSGNPVYVDYQLAKSETIPLPSIEPITLFEGTNVFELVTNLGTTLKVEYIVNAETLQNEITELSNAVIELGGTL